MQITVQASAATGGIPLPLNPPGVQILGADTTLQYRSEAVDQVIRRADFRRQFMDKYPRITAGLPTERERHVNRKRIREAEWEHANRHTDFAVQDDTGAVHYATVVPAYRNFENSLWHALSYQVNGAGAGVDNNYLGLRGGRREKAWLFNYFMDALNDPTHPRHRAYTWLQQSEKSSGASEGEDQAAIDTRVALLKAWGELSMMRALAINKPHAGRPKWPAFPGIFQLISDFFKMEVIVFVGRTGLPVPKVEDPAAPIVIGGPTSTWRVPYGYHVFGKRSFGTLPDYANKASGNGNGQLFFVTNEDWQHFDAVKFKTPFDLTSADQWKRSFNTGNTDNEHRYGARRYPWMGAGGPRSLPDVPARVDPVTNLVYARPADDPMYRLGNNHDYVVQARNDINFLDHRFGGRMPRLITRTDMDENWAPGAPVAVDVAPTLFYPWSITSGGFWARNRRTGTMQWQTGLYADKVGKIFYDTRNTLWAQGGQFEIGEGRQEPNETHVLSRPPHIQFKRQKTGVDAGRALRITRRGQEFPSGFAHWDGGVMNPVNAPMSPPNTP